MRYRIYHSMIVLMLLLVPVYLISCSGNTTTSLPSGQVPAEMKVGPPGQPTALTASGADGHVDLTWTPPAGENIATSYNLYWSTTGGVNLASDMILNVSMPFAHRELENGTTYYYRVSGVNIYGEGPLSGEVQAAPMLPFTRILAKLTDPDAEVNDKFGFAVSMSGDYAIVGAWKSQGPDHNNHINNAGAAYIFYRNGSGVWIPGPEGVQRLAAADSQEGDRFGFSVSISGEYAIVGASGEDYGTGDPYEDAGAAYVYHRSSLPNIWDAGMKLTSPQPHILASFGYAVAISGDYAIVGSPGDNCVFIFHRTDLNAWDSVTTLSMPSPGAGDKFGVSVAISGDYAIVGASGENGMPDSPMIGTGAAYLFRRVEANNWVQASKIMPYDSEENDAFGHSVAISGEYAIVGAPQKNVYRGAAYIFRRITEDFWDEGPKVVATDGESGDFFGWSVAINAGHALVGAYAEDCGWDNSWYEGTVYVFKRIGSNTWDNGTKLTIPQGDSGDGFGYSVAISEESAIVGAIGDDGNEEMTSNAGAVYLY